MTDNQQSELIYLTPEEVAKLLRVKVRTVYSLLRNNKIKGVKIGERIWRVDKSQFANFSS